MRKEKLFMLLKVFLVALMGAATVYLILVMYRGYQDKLAAIPVEKENVVEYPYKKKTVDGNNYFFNTDLISLLALGVDDSDDQMTGQTDLVNLVVFDRDKKRIKIIAISRDSMVPIRTYDAKGGDLGWRENHLALAYPFAGGGLKGCLMAQEAVSKMFLEIPIVYYGAMNMSALSDFQEVVGELRIPIPEEDLLYTQETMEKKDKETSKEEVWIITKDNVEDFLRTRDTELAFSNEKRMKRQRLYVEAYLDALKNMLESDFAGTLEKLNSVFGDVMTNINVNEIEAFADMVLHYSFNQSRDYLVVKGENVEGELHDEFYVDEAALQKLTLDIFYKKESK